MPPAETNPTTAVERALNILEAAPSAATASQRRISRSSEPKSSASYILRTLEKRSYLRREQNRRYSLGLKISASAETPKANLDIAPTSPLPFMRTLVKRFE